MLVLSPYRIPACMKGVVDGSPHRLGRSEVSMGIHLMDLVALGIDQVLGERHQAGSQCLLERVGTKSVNVQHHESSSHLPLHRERQTSAERLTRRLRGLGRT